MQKLAAPAILQAILSDNPRFFTLSENRKLDILSNFELTDFYDNKIFEMQFEDMQPTYDYIKIIAAIKELCKEATQPKESFLTKIKKSLSQRPNKK